MVIDENFIHICYICIKVYQRRGLLKFQSYFCNNLDDFSTNIIRDKCLGVPNSNKEYTYRWYVRKMSSSIIIINYHKHTYVTVYYRVNQI